MTLQLDSRSVPTQGQFSGFSSVKEIQLEPARAQSWLAFLEAAQNKQSSSISFTETLDEACWLASWKREYVRFDVEVADVPVILSFIAEIDDPQYFEAQQDILNSLSIL